MNRITVVLLVSCVGCGGVNYHKSGMTLLIEGRCFTPGVVFNEPVAVKNGQAAFRMLAAEVDCATGEVVRR